MTPADPEDQPGGAGDERAPRVPAVFTVRRGKLTPPEVSVPAFFRVELTVRNRDDRRHVVAVRGQRDLPVEARSTSRRIVAGLRRGSYLVRVDGRPAGVLVSGLEPGP